jgi:hypothetical protein
MLFSFHSRILAALVVVVVGLTGACRSVAAQDYPKDYFELPATPVDVEAVGDAQRRAVATIGPAGGTISATSADGAQYRLLVPPKALAEDTEIAMTPIIELTGAPEPRSNLPGVILEPDGLIFDLPAKLMMSRADLAQNKITGVVTGLGTGQDLIVSGYDLTAETVSISLSHFTIYRIDADALAKAAKASRPRDAGRRLTNAVQAEMDAAGARTADQREQAMRNSRIQSLLFEYKSYLFKAAVAANGNPGASCSALTQSLNAFLDLTNLVRPDGSNTRQPSWLPYFAEVSETLLNVMRTRCRKAAEAECAKTLSARPIDTHAVAESTLEKTDLRELFAWQDAARRKCMNVTILVETSQDGVLTDGFKCRHPVKIDLIVRIAVAARGRNRPSGASGAHANKPIAATAIAPMKAELILPGSIRGMTPSGLSAATLAVVLDPGQISMKFQVRTAGGTDVSQVDDWWRQNFDAHMRSYQFGSGFLFKMPAEANNAGERTATFTGTGSYTEPTQTWSGKETVKITILPPGQ